MTQQFSRRDALKLALQTSAIVAISQFSRTSPAYAESGSSGNLPSVSYQSFVPYSIARRGGKQTLYAYEGTRFTIHIPERSSEGDVVQFINNETQVVRSITLHTLYDRNSKIGLEIFEELDSRVDFLLESSRDRCKLIYEGLEDGQPVADLEALGLLDYIVLTSKLSGHIQQQYKIASENSKVLRILDTIQVALDASSLSPAEKQGILGTFAQITAGDSISNISALPSLDAIVAGSALPIELKERYGVASTASLAFTADLAILNLLDDLPNSNELIAVYSQVRDGQELIEDDRLVAKEIDHRIAHSTLPPTFINMYAVARAGEFQEANQKGAIKLVQELNEASKDARKARNIAAGIIPNTTKVLTSVGVEASTGAAISSLSGGAAMNATLAFLGGGSVAAGGLGMLGGLAVATGGAALIGAAGVLSYAFVSELDRQDYVNLGISVGSGAVVGTAATVAAWTFAGAGGSLTGAAALSATIAALGGVSILTGGTALVASGTAFVVWSLLKRSKKRDGTELQAIEVRLHALTEPPRPGSFAQVLIDSLPDRYESYIVYKGENLDLQQAKNSIKTWLKLEEDEKILAEIDTTFWNDLKGGICFTDRRIVWKKTLQDAENISYSELKQVFSSRVSSILSSGQDGYDSLQKVVDLAETLLNEDSQREFAAFLNNLVQTPEFGSLVLT
jgi:hypothetical protein